MPNMLALLLMVPPAGDDLKKFEGQWISVEIKQGLKKSGEAGEWVRYEFRGADGKGWSSKNDDPKRVTDFRITLIPNTQPKRIIIIVSQSGRIIGKVHGIYQFEKGRLLLCHDETNTSRYPPSFKRAANRQIIVLERVKAFRKRLEGVFD